MIRIAISLVAAVIAIGIAYQYGVFLFAWKWVLSLKLFGKAYALRWLQAPLWRVVTKAFIIVFGLRTMNMIRGYIAQAIERAKRIVREWRTLPLWFRATIGAGVLIGVGVTGFGMLILPIWIPLLKPVVRKLHMMWMDRVVNRWIKPVRKHYRLFMRSNPLFRIIRKPHRAALYYIVIGIRRGGRWTSKQMIDLWQWARS